MSTQNDLARDEEGETSVVSPTDAVDQQHSLISNQENRLFIMILTRLKSTTTLWLTGYLFATVSTPLIINFIALNGGAPKGSFLTALPGSIAMCLLIFLKPSAFHHGKIQWIPSISVGVLEAGSQAIILSGLALAGSVIYTVAYSSTTMYTAILAFLLLKKSLHPLQWAGVVMVMAGLAVVSIGAEEDGTDVVAGFFMILCGSLTHALTYIGSEYVLSFCEDPVEPELFSFINGVFGTLINLLWQCFYTIPRYKTLLIDSISAAHGSITKIILCYISLVIIGALHQLCFLQIIMRIGSTSTGLCKGISSSLVFIFGHLFYCQVQSSQCFTWSKGLSLCIVITGVTLYAVNSTHKKSRSLSYERLNDDSTRHGLSEMEMRGTSHYFEGQEEDTTENPIKIDSAIGLSE
jgi:drug/metabolite transporter (DMT)-like permease